MWVGVSATPNSFSRCCANQTPRPSLKGIAEILGGFTNQLLEAIEVRLINFWRATAAVFLPAIDLATLGDQYPFTSGGGSTIEKLTDLGLGFALVSEKNDLNPFAINIRDI